MNMLSTEKQTEEPSNGYLGLKETMRYLSVSKMEIEKLVKTRRLTAFKLGGSYLRFRKDQLLIVKHELDSIRQEQSAFGSRAFSQFWSFNGFYVVTSAVLSGLLFYFLCT